MLLETAGRCVAFNLWNHKKNCPEIDLPAVSFFFYISFFFISTGQLFFYYYLYFMLASAEEKEIIKKKEFRLVRQQMLTRKFLYSLYFYERVNIVGVSLNSEFYYVLMHWLDLI